MASSTPTSPAGGPAASQPMAAVAVREYVRGYLGRVRSGEFGALPIIFGLVVISTIFQNLNQNFLTAQNLANLLVQGSGIAVIAMGVVFVLILGEIDLSVGYVSGVGAAILALTVTGKSPWPWELSVLAAVAACALIGCLQGTIVALLRIPSFVVTLAGLLGWNGVVLLLVADRGTIPIDNPVIVGVANSLLTPDQGWIALGIGVALYVAFLFGTYIVRRRRNLTVDALPLLIFRVVAVGGLGAVVVFLCNENRGLLVPIQGVPVITVLIVVMLVVLSILAGRTKFGRHVYAVGGNAEAARRAGINVAGVRIAVFTIASAMAALGGIVLASRLRSVDTGVGGGNILLYSIASAVIGGTSLFGGRGKVVHALLGATVIQAIDNGMGLLSLSAGAKFAVTGLVLFLAAAVDALSRRGRTAAGLG
ncbi:MAG TPA: ABC transporter permease [Candidatus Dormibacteraeota bacterium]|nr:ABC transporter permease [Candidatus Dormibacteraeota bacterium]